MKKFMLRVIPVVLVAAIVLFNSVYAYDPVNDQNNQSISTVDNAVQKVWGTILTVLQVAAVGALVYAGVKYMFANADSKAQIKEGMIGLVVGAILVFGASSVIKLIINASNEVLPGK